MSKTYTPHEVAVIVLKKSEELLKASIGGLTPTKLTPVPGVISPSNNNTASPSKVGSQSVVKQAKPKKMGQTTDKPSVFFNKSEQKQELKKKSVNKLSEFLTAVRSKKKS
jgi:hypothetical protein